MKWESRKFYKQGEKNEIMEKLIENKTIYIFILFLLMLKFQYSLNCLITSL